MTRIRVPVALLAVLMAALAVVSLVALPAAAADLPFQGAGAAEAAVVLPGQPFALDVDGLMPGDDLGVQSVALPASHTGPYRLRAVTSGSDELARFVEVRVATSAGVLLYEGPLGAAVASGDSSGGGEALAVSLRLSPAAGNDVQGAQLAVRWELQGTDGGVVDR
jgi:hypothetical protein